MGRKKLMYITYFYRDNDILKINRDDLQIATASYGDKERFEYSANSDDGFILMDHKEDTDALTSIIKSKFAEWYHDYKKNHAPIEINLEKDKENAKEVEAASKEDEFCGEDALPYDAVYMVEMSESFDGLTISNELIPFHTKEMAERYILEHTNPENENRKYKYSEIEYTAERYFKTSEPHPIMYYTRFVESVDGFTHTISFPEAKMINVKTSFWSEYEFGYRTLSNIGGKGYIVLDREYSEEEIKEFIEKESCKAFANMLYYQ